MTTKEYKTRSFKNTKGLAEVVRIVGNNREEIRECFVDNINRAGGLHYSIAVRSESDPDKAEIYYRPSNPCLGDLTTYRSSHKEKGSYNKSRPSDLLWDFPTGEILAITYSYMSYPTILDDLTYSILDYFEIKDYEMVECEISPVIKRGNPNISKIEGLKLGHPIFWDMDVHPNKIFSCLYDNRYRTQPHFLSDHPGISGAELYAFVKNNFLFRKEGYTFLSNIDRIAPILERNFKEFPGGTYREGYGYVRNGNEYPWVLNKPKKFDFSRYEFVDSVVGHPVLKFKDGPERYYQNLKQIIKDYIDFSDKETKNV
jgi:hypothetical protein